MHSDVMHSKIAIEVSQSTKVLPATAAPEMQWFKSRCMYRLVGDVFCKPLGAASNVLDAAASIVLNGDVVKMYVGCMHRHP